MIERHEITSRDQWLKLRLQDVTASDIAALFGNSHPWRTTRGLWEEKVNGEIEDFDNSVLRRGRLLEDVVAVAAREEHPDWLIEKQSLYFRDPEARIGATPDFLVTIPGKGLGAFQAKTVAPAEFRRRWVEAPPIHVVLQTLTEAMLMEKPFGVVAALIVDPYHLPLVEYFIDRDEQAEKKLRSAVAQFWHSVAEKRPPDFDFERDAALVASLYPREVQGSTIDLSRDNSFGALLEERDKLALEIAPLESRKKAVDVEIKAKIGDHECAMCNGRKVTWKLRKPYVANVGAARVLHVGKPVDAK